MSESLATAKSIDGVLSANVDATRQNIETAKAQIKEDQKRDADTLVDSPEAMFFKMHMKKFVAELQAKLKEFESALPREEADAREAALAVDELTRETKQASGEMSAAEVAFRLANPNKAMADRQLSQAYGLQQQLARKEIQRFDRRVQNSEYVPRLIARATSDASRTLGDVGSYFKEVDRSHSSKLTQAAHNAAERRADAAWGRALAGSAAASTTRAAIQVKAHDAGASHYNKAAKIADGAAKAQARYAEAQAKFLEANAKTILGALDITDPEAAAKGASALEKLAKLEKEANKAAADAAVALAKETKKGDAAHDKYLAQDSVKAALQAANKVINTVRAVGHAQSAEEHAHDAEQDAKLAKDPDISQATKDALIDHASRAAQQAADDADRAEADAKAAGEGAVAAQEAAKRAREAANRVKDLLTNCPYCKCVPACESYQTCDCKPKPKPAEPDPPLPLPETPTKGSAGAQPQVTEGYDSPPKDFGPATELPPKSPAGTVQNDPNATEADEVMPASDEAPAVEDYSRGPSNAFLRRYWHQHDLKHANDVDFQRANKGPGDDTRLTASEKKQLEKERAEFDRKEAIKLHRYLPRLAAHDGIIPIPDSRGDPDAPKLAYGVSFPPDYDPASGEMPDQVTVTELFGEKRRGFITDPKYIARAVEAAARKAAGDKDVELSLHGAEFHEFSWFGKARANAKDWISSHLPASPTREVLLAAAQRHVGASYKVWEGVLARADQGKAPTFAQAKRLAGIYAPSLLIPFVAPIAGKIISGVAKGIGKAFTGKTVEVVAKRVKQAERVVKEIEDVVKKSKKAIQLEANAAAGKAWEKATEAELEASGKIIARQVTLRTKAGVKVRVDFIYRDGDKIVIIEAKASRTARLTDNQKKGFPQIYDEGATVVGKGKPGFEGGTLIPKGTKVHEYRPGGNLP